MDERRRLERRAARGDEAARRRLDEADSSLRWAKDVWMSDREFLPGQVRLLEELGRRGRLLASTVSGYHYGVAVRLHDAEDSPPRGRDWRLVTIIEFRRYEDKGLDMKSMGPKSALRRLLEGLRRRFGARSRLLELREEWERRGTSPESEWVPWAKSRLREGDSRLNPGRRKDEERLARRAASGDPSAARRLEAERKAAEADRLPAAEREYLRHVGEILLVRALLVSTEEWGMSEDVDLRRPVRVRVLGQRDFDDGTRLGPRIEGIEDGEVQADWPVALLDRVTPANFEWPDVEVAKFIVGEQDELYPRGTKGYLWVMADSDVRRSWRRA